MTSSLHTLAQRLRTVEARLAEIEGGYGETIYRLRREVVSVRIGQGRILTHLGLPEVTSEEIDTALDAE
ncbi:MAG: hypothetical protein ACRDRX_25590 [Pseudonocardiaceae bacterium]